MAKSLITIQTDDRVLGQIQQNVKQMVDPIGANPLVNGQLLQSITLTTGANVINHKLGRVLVGWFMTRVRSNATFYDTQDSCPTPNLTLQLVASAGSVCDIYVF